MTPRCDLHVHTVYSDGHDTPEEIVKAAVERGMTCVGFSDHSYTPFDESYCMKRGSVRDYVSEIGALKEKYAGQIKILCGVEQDYYSDEPTDMFDYVIGSVHYIFADGEYFPIDDSFGRLLAETYGHFGGDIYALADEYYRTVADVAAKTGADVIGHFDLISKFNEGGAFFDESDPRYISAWRRATDALLPLGVPFEINTGAISRGYRTVPYPSSEIIGYIKQNGGVGEGLAVELMGEDCNTKVEIVAVKGGFVPAASVEEQFDMYGLSEDKMAKRLKD